MPELPEVETVARDLRGLVVGARIAEIRVSWLKTLRSQDEGAFAEAVVGRAIVGTSRRAKLVVLELDGGLGADREALPDDGAAITIHLKMTGPAVRRPRGPAGGSVRPPRPGLRGRARAVVPRHPQVRAGRASRDGIPRPATSSGELGGPKGVQGLRARAAGSRGSRRGSSGAGSVRGKGRLKPLLLDQAFIAGVGNIYADEALWAARLHPLRSAASLCDRRAARGCTASDPAILAEAVARRGSSIDDYTAPEGDGEMQERLLVYQRAGEPCARCGRPVRRIVDRRASDPLLLVVPAAAAGGAGARPRRSCAGWSRSRAGARSAQTGARIRQAGRAGRRSAAPTARSGRRRARRAGPAAVALGSRAERTQTRARRPRGERRPGRSGVTDSGARGRLMSILRLEASPSRGRRRSSSSTGSTPRSRSAIGRPGRPERGRQDDVAPDRRRASTSRTLGKVARKRDLSIGMLAQEAHLDAAFMAAPDIRTAVRHGAAHLEAMAAELEAMEHAGRRRGACV